MFKKNLKLLATMIGLVAVLVMGLAMLGVTQQNPLSRASVVNAINNAVAATLTAAEGDVFDLDNAKFYSDARVAFGYIPLHPSSRSLQLLEQSLEDLFAGSQMNVVIGALYLPDDVPGFLRAGTYKVKLINKDRVVLIDQEDREVFVSKGVVEDTRGKPGPFPSWQVTVSNPKITIELHFFCKVTITIIIEWE